MNKEMTITKGMFTEKDLDKIYGMMLIFAHAMERCLSLAEMHYAAEYRGSNDYKRLCKAYGKAYAGEIVRRGAHKVISHDKKHKFGEIIAQAKRLYTMMEKVSETAMVSCENNAGLGEAYDALHHDVNFLCKIYALMGNCTGEDDEIKLMSTVKMLAKGDRISERVIDAFNIEN